MDQQGDLADELAALIGGFVRATTELLEAGAAGDRVALFEALAELAARRRSALELAGVRDELATSATSPA